MAHHLPITTISNSPNRLIALGEALSPRTRRKTGSSWPIFLRPGPVDFRKGINGLTNLCRDELRLKPASGALFVFCNKGRNRVKLLLWDRNGWWLCLKRLEEGKFPWPKSGRACKITPEQLRWLLDGVDFFNSHPVLRYD
jgi:transposase